MGFKRGKRGKMSVDRGERGRGAFACCEQKKKRKKRYTSNDNNNKKSIEGKEREKERKEEGELSSSFLISVQSVTHIIHV